MAETRRLYQGAYRSELEDVTTPDSEPSTQDVDGTDTSEQNLTPSESTWKKRYGDLRSHTNSLTTRISELETQLRASSQKEIKFPSSPEEIQDFANKYPDVYRNIRSIAMTEFLQEKENIVSDTKAIRDDIEGLKMERGLQKVLLAHPDFYELDNSEDFKAWAHTQPKQIQDWLFEVSDPDLCIKAIDFYKAEKNVKTKPVRRAGADTLIPTRGGTDITDEGGKKVWKASEIKKMHPSVFERFEEEIDQARREGRLDDNA